MAYGGRGGDIGGSSSGFWGRLQQEANTRLQKTTSRMEEVAREMARRQAEAEQRRREEEERRRQQEAERQRREAEQRAEEQKRQQEAESRMKLLEDQKRARDAQDERGKLVLAGLNHNDHENYRNAVEADPMLNQAKWERNMAVMTGDTRTAEEAGNWIRDREKTIRGNTIPQTRSMKTLAEYQAEWNQDAGRLAEERARKAAESRALQSREGLSAYTRAQEDEKKAQAEADKAKQWQAEQSADDEHVLAEARELAVRMGYREEDLPGTVEEMAALDPRIAENEQIHQYLSDKAFVAQNAVRAKETADTAKQAVEDARNNAAVTAEDWGDLDRFNKNEWTGAIFNPLDEDREQIRDQIGQVTRGIRNGEYNDPQRATAEKVRAELERRGKILDDPKKAGEDIDLRIAFLRGLSGPYWDERGSEIEEQISRLEKQKTLIDTAGLDKEDDWSDDAVQSGYDAWRNAPERRGGDSHIGLTHNEEEDRWTSTDVSALQHTPWDLASDDGGKLYYLNDKERARYFYLYGKSPERAAEYLNALEDQVHDRRTARQGEIFQQEADRTPILSNLTASGLEITKPMSAIVTMVDNLVMGNDYHEDTVANYADAYQRAIRGRSKEQLTKWAEGKGWSPALITGLTGAYDVATSIADNLIRAYGTAGMGVTNSAVTTGLMAFGAAGSTMRDLMAEGIDPQRAALVGAVSGIGEFVTEKMSDAKLFEIMEDGWIGVKKGLKSAAQTAFMEGWTEEASNLIQLAGEAVTLQGEDSYNKKIKDYYYYTGSMDEARKLALQDMIGEGIYTMVVSGLSGAGMDIGGRTISGVWNHYTKAKQKELSGEGDSTQADTARDSYGTQDGAEAAAEGAMPQYSTEELDEALMAAAAPMTAQEQQTDAVMTGQETADAVTAEADAQRAAEAAQIQRNDNVARIAREMAAGENARLAGVEDMPVERRAEGPAEDYRQNDRMPAGVQAQQAADRAEVEPMPVARREEMPAAEPGTVEAKVQAVPLVREQTVKRLAQEKVRKLADEWISEDDSAEDVMKNATLADVKANAHDDSADGIHDDAAWRETAGSVYDDLMDQYGADLADDTDGIWGKLAGYLTGQVKDVSEVFAKTNNPLFSTMQRGELYVMAGNIAEEYTRRMEAMKLKAREMGKKYGFVTGEDVKADGGNGVVLRTVGDDMSAEQVTQLRILDRFAKNLRADGLPGLTINVYKDIRSTDGGKLNGSYNTDGTVKDAATVNLSLDAEGGAILRAAGHELYHMVETWGKTQADKIRGFVLNALEATEGYDLDARRAELKEAYGEDADIDSEIVADSMFDVLNNEETVTQVMKENKGLGQRIKEFVGKISAALRSAVERIAGMGSREAQALKDQADVLEKIRDMWTRGVEIAQRNIQAARAAENVEGYSIKAVADAEDSEGRTAALDTVAGELVAKTQGDLMGDDAAENIGLRRKMMNALKAYGKGEKSLSAALEEQGLQPITGENDRKAAAWLSREAAEPARIQVSDKLSRQTLEEQFHEIWDEDDDVNTIFTDGPRNTAERALDLLYKIHDSRDRKGLWKEHLDSFVEEIAEDSDVDRDKIKNMLTLLYTSIDNENRVYSQNAADYAGLIVDEIVNAHRGAERAVSEDETAVYKGLRGTVIQLSDALAPTSKQTKKDGTSLKYTKYDYGDINRYGTTVRQLNNFGRAAGIKFQIRGNEKNRGVAPSTLLAENPTLAAWVGFGDIDDNGNEADLLNRILDWVDSYERRSTMPADPDRLNKLGYGKVEKIILNYFDMPGQLDDTQRAVNAIRKQAEADQKELQDEIYGLRWMIDYQNEKIEDARNERQMAVDELTRQEKAAAAAQRRIEKMKLREETLKQRNLAERQIKTMRQWFLHPTKEDGKHVSEELRSTIATALSLVDTGSRNPESIRTYDFNQLIAAIDQEQSDTGYQLVVDPDLVPTLKELAKTTQGKMLMEMDGTELKNMNDALKAIIKMCRDADKLRVKNMKEGVAQLSDSLIGGLQTQKDAKVSGTKIQGAKDFINYTMMDPQRYFDMLARRGGETGSKIWDILRKDGLDKQIQLTEECKRRFDEAVGKYDYKNWAGGRNQTTHTFDLVSGEQITLTDGQIMTLYLLNKREQARLHIYGDGIAAGRADVRGRQIKQDRPNTVTEADVKNIISALSDEQIQAADAIQKIVGVWGSELGNETSMALYGYKKFKENSYFPIKTMSDTLGVKGTELEQDRKAASLYAVTNKGFTKELNAKARNALELNNIFDVALDHIAGMITYNAWGAPLTDVTRILNYKNENSSVIREMNRTLGKAGTNYLVQLLRDINGLTKDSVEGKAASFTRMFRNFKAAAVGWNLSTVMKQGLSIVRAFDVIPSHYFLTARQVADRFKKDGEGKRIDGLMEKYSPIYAWKQDGRFTMDTGKDLKSIMLPKTETAANKFTEIGMAGAGMADNMTWRTIWLAAEKMTEKRHTDLKKGSEEYYRAVGDLFTQCIDKTQVVDSILHRTEVMRSNSMWIKLGTSFMGEPLKTWNQMTDAVRAFAENKNTVTGKRLIKTSMVLLTSAALQATVASIISGLRHWSDDEPLEETIRKYLLGEYDGEKGFLPNAVELLFGNNLAGELNPINYIPFARDLSDIVQGHDVTRDDMQMLTRLWETGSALVNDTGKASTWKKLADFGGAVGDLMGVPASNITKELNYVSNWGSRALEAMGLNTLGVQYYNLMWNKAMGKATNMTEYARFMKKVEEAVADGRCEQEFADYVRKTLIGSGYEEGKLDEKVAKMQLAEYTDESTQAGYYAALAQARKDRDREAEKDITAALKRMGVSDEAIQTGVYKAQMAEYTDGTTVAEFYDEYLNRVFSGDRTAATAINGILSGARSKDAHESSIKSALKERPEIVQAARDRMNGNMNGYQAAVDKCEQMGIDKDLAIKAVNSAINAIKAEEKVEEPAGGNEREGAEPEKSGFGEGYGYAYADLHGALIDGTDFIDDILQDLIGQGKKNSGIMSSVTHAVKPYYLELKRSSDPNDQAEAEALKQRLINLGIGYTETKINGWR